MNTLEPGIYRHYKGGLYRVFGIFLDEATHVEMVAYESLDDQKRWVRPLSVFLEHVTQGNVEQPRFTFLKSLPFL